MEQVLFTAGWAFSFAAYAFALVMGVTATMVVGGVGTWLVRIVRHALTPYRPGWPARLAAWRAARPFREADRRLGAAGELHEGQLARLVGVVVSAETLPGELSGIACVVCRYAFGERRGGKAGAGSAVADFVLRLRDGTEVRVLAAAANERRRLRIVDDSPHRWSSAWLRGAWCWESRVCLGQEIEVVGLLERQVDPSAARLGDRSPALRWLVAPTRHGLCLRFSTTVPAALPAASATPPGRLAATM